MSIVAKKILMASEAEATPSDDEFNRTSFLSHFDGTNNGVNNQFTDGSASNHTVTANGNVTQGSFGPFSRPDGEWGVSFDGDSDYLQVAASSDFDFGTGDFTFECSFFKSDVGDYEYLMSFGNNTNADSIALYIQNGLVKVYNGAAIFNAGSTTVTLNTWHHVAVVRISSTLKMYLDGNQVHSVSNSSNIASTGGANIANWRLAGDAQYFNGVISNARVVKGTGVYTGNFTPSTSKLTAITNTKLLTCQSNRFVDNSATGHTVTAYATSAITAFGSILTSEVYDPAVNGASGSFGSGNYLTSGANTDWTVGTGNFTVEFWIYPTDYSQPYMPVVTIGDSTGGLLIGKSQVDGNGFGAYPKGTGGAVVRSATFPQINAWTHVLFSRSGTSVKLFYNGVQKVVNQSGYNFGAGSLTVGSYNGYSRYWGGNITDLRYVKGTATATSNFTPPTAPLPAITNTKLLLNMADGQAIDSAAQNNMVLSGNAKVSTGQAKFGDTSTYFDGSGDFAYLPDPSVGHFIEGNFTAECWVYPTASPSQPIIMGQWSGRDRKSVV